MYKFKGTINGVEYTNRNEFFDALKSSHGDKLNVVIYEDNRIEENKTEDKVIESSRKTNNKNVVEEKAPQINENYYENLFNTIGDLFISFLKTQNNDLYKKLVQEIDDNSKPENENNVENVKDFNEFVAKYFFKETTYTFKGDTEDEFHLDRFAGLLKDRSQEIEDEMLFLNKSQKSVLYNKALSEISRITKQIGKIEDERVSTDRELAGIEKIISSYKEIGYIIPQEIEDSYNKQKNSFDILTNRISYYQILADYYRTIGPKLDPVQ